MAHTARSDKDKEEFFDSPEVLAKKVAQLAQWIKKSNHTICFTGAGISTGAGIPDYRSGMDTKLETGPGVWELRANSGQRDQTKHRVTPMIKAIPTPTHMMFVKLQEEGIMKCCISQNTDGLHRRSGLPKSALCELHGNGNLERCDTCGNEYLRDAALKRAWLPNHLTGRKCDDYKCQGPLKDTIIHFGESLPVDEITKAFAEGEEADLCLVMGSSLTVTPAADIPQRVAERGKKLIIVNLQRTPLHNAATLVIHAKCEDVSRMLMSNLGMEIPEFKLKRRMVIRSSPLDSDTTMLTVEGRDIDGLPFSYFKEVLVTVGRDTHTLLPPFQLKVGWPVKDQTEQTLKIKVSFFANYGEPPLSREITIKKDKEFHESLLIIYSTVNGTWSVTSDDQMTAAMAGLSVH